MGQWERPLHPASVQPHLAHVPDYLVPPSLRGIAKPGPKKKKCPRGAGARRGGNKPRGSGNPLQSFRFAQRGTKRGTKRGAGGTP
ncbi:probable ATP-dependent RNA helicase DDX56 isoform X3 [Corvus moneduloides]|uniref:probable ATP-dependent RNA helicase DDX56 isoform X2 n=1 Tax=Corvus moneduloides TaxID=1196302 RepID=UPI00136434DC|nr:probable ATP-dependent RNA helicase DDX56 isoform X2 [Corvus moneduloides]XP_031948143.1 probable ATP-dependent RNA helicase DDX56 isoform X3 [Corvus moneduloides]